MEHRRSAYTPPAPTGPKRKYNALGILEDVTEGRSARATRSRRIAPATTGSVLDVAPAEPSEAGRRR